MIHRSLSLLLSCVLPTAAIRVEFNVPTDPDDLAAFGHPIYNEVCDPVISLVQVQDSTATFEAFIAALAELHIIEDLVAGLKDTYGAAEYGMATFGDKPAPLHGFGRGWSVWQPGFDSSKWSPDQCYTAHLSLQTLTDSTSIWDAVTISGGKDFEENQFDALAKAAVDPFFWDHATESSRHARIAVLITDDFSHISGSRSADIGTFGFNTSYRETQRYYNASFGSFKEDSNSFRIVEDLGSAALKWPVGPAGSEVDIKGNDAYRSFVICHDSEGMDSVKYRKDILKRLSESGVDIGTTDIDVPAQTKTWWEAFCAAKYDAFTVWNFDGVFKWANQYKFVEESAIKEYRYTDMAVGTDVCTEYEYPDVSDGRYGDMFKKNGVIPTVILIPQLPTLESE
ncbi:MAG: uncharacterized protein KVP18_003603 [Porospora cf. gigantea A]|uniref:uncharacterized protein n=1 Tax=Porospora cf. gigantea A TaxID=2853593 RepID=UPI00355AB087|nr:MAG: hypothetical protein KVP18_003603 [Porospora cf. gigantea A]